MTNTLQQCCRVGIWNRFRETENFPSYFILRSALAQRSTLLKPHNKKPKNDKNEKNKTIFEVIFKDSSHTAVESIQISKTGLLQNVAFLITQPSCLDRLSSFKKCFFFTILFIFISKIGPSRIDSMISKISNKFYIRTQNQFYLMKLFHIR